MRTRLIPVVILSSVLTLPVIARSQAPPPMPPMDVHALKNFLQIGAPSPVPTSRVPDFSGDWAIGIPGTKSTTGFLGYQWVCSVRDNYENYDKVGKPGKPGETTFK